jgi:uncharacterized protein YdeI (YjbR/CyaY-like superfamily)
MTEGWAMVDSDVPPTGSEHPTTWKFGYQIYHAETRTAWRAWLAANHATAPGVWLASWKRGANRPTVAYEEAVEEALCFGWIDSTVNTLDEERGLQLMTPRRPRSSWTRLNRERVARLEAEGRMTEAGRRAVVVAKHNGWWLLYDTVEDLLEPDELSAALDEVPQARAHWDAFPPVGAQADALVGRQCRQGRYAGSAGRGDRGQRRTGSARE